MRISRADRSFWAIIAVAAGVAGGAWAVLCCGAWALTSEIADHGWSVLEQLRLLPALVLVAFLGAALLLTFVSLVRQALATARLRHVLSRGQLAAPANLVGAAATAGLDHNVTLVDLPQPFSCTYGIVRPTVAISRGLFERVDEDELVAVLAHEAQHVRARDPLKVVVARAIRCGLFVLPVLGELYERYLTTRELAADRRASRQVGVEGLAGALLKAVGGPAELEVGAAAALAGDRDLELRIAQLETGREPSLSPLQRRRLWATGATALVLGGVMAVAAVGLGPLVARICHC